MRYTFGEGGLEGLLLLAEREEGFRGARVGLGGEETGAGATEEVPFPENDADAAAAFSAIFFFHSSLEGQDMFTQISILNLGPFNPTSGLLHCGQDL